MNAIVLMSIAAVFCQLLTGIQGRNLLPCMSWTDQQPDICQDMLRRDPKYCEDYGDRPFCRRTCSPCGPARGVKIPFPAADCADQRNDCSSLMHLHSRDQCNEQPVYAFKYCKKYCNLC